MEDKQLNDLSYRIIGAGVEVHRVLGPGLLESTYRTCMAYEMRERQMNVITEPLLILESFFVSEWDATRPHDVDG